MSTRCQIKLRTEDETVNTIYIYKHSDGYPEGVLPTLVPLVNEFMKSRGWDGAYLLCQIIRAFALEDYKAFTAQPDVYKYKIEGSYRFLGWGLDTIQHGDIDYLYEIDEKGSIYINGKKLTQLKAVK